jgi:hypothetical protein
MYGLHAGNRHELMHRQFTFDNPTATPLNRIVVTCLLSLIFAINLLTARESSIRTGLERPYAFRDTPIRPLSIAFEQDTRAYMKNERYEVSLDLWRMPSAGNQRPATGIDLWSLMIGVDF